MCHWLPSAFSCSDQNIVANHISELLYTQMHKRTPPHAPPRMKPRSLDINISMYSVMLGFLNTHTAVFQVLQRTQISLMSPLFLGSAYIMSGTSRTVSYLSEKYHHTRGWNLRTSILALMWRWLGNVHARLAEMGQSNVMLALMETQDLEWCSVARHHLLCKSCHDYTNIIRYYTSIRWFD